MAYQLGEYGVVFSGGGALAAWEVGCLRALIKRNNGYAPSVIGGASAGAINAVCLAAGMSLNELGALWNRLRPPEVYRARPRQHGWTMLVALALWQSAKHASFGQGINHALSVVDSLLDPSPLAGTLRNNLQCRWKKFRAYQGKIVLATTDLRFQRSTYFYSGGPAISDEHWHPIKSFDDLVSVLMATSAIPLAFPPHGQFVDGGVARNQPLIATLKLMPPGQPVFVVIPQPELLPQSLTLASLPARVLNLWLTAGLHVELRQVGLVNTVRAAKKQPLTPVFVIRSSVHLEGLGSGLLKFGKSVRAIRKQGFFDGLDQLKTFNRNDPLTWPEPARPLSVI